MIKEIKKCKCYTRSDFDNGFTNQEWEISFNNSLYSVELIFPENEKIGIILNITKNELTVSKYRAKQILEKYKFTFIRFYSEFFRWKKYSRHNINLTLKNYFNNN